MKPTIRIGSQGAYVIEAQQDLNNAGFKIGIDGFFGGATESAVKQFQKSLGMVQDGIVGPNTWAGLDKFSENPNQAFSPIVDEYIPLLQGEYIAERSQKLGICYHHTVSDGNPEAVVRSWNGDSRGGVATHFIIGREMLSGDTSHDGEIIQCLPLEFWAHHILTTRMGFSSYHNNTVNKSYVGIELCSWGCLQKEGDKFYTLDGRIPIPSDQVCTLDTPFRTYKYWHKYTEKQMSALEKLTTELSKKLGLNLSQGWAESEPAGPLWWELSWEAMALRRVLTTHTNFEYGKFDTFPQPEFIDLIKKIT